jgi:hypothetical protein
MSKQQLFETTLLESSVSKVYDDAINEWTIVNIIEQIVDPDKKCICMKKNNYYYKIINKENKNILFIGFDCIKKYCPNLINDATILSKQLNYKNTSKEQNKRICHACHKYKIDIDTDHWRTICKGCWSNGTKTAQPIPILGNRMCDMCFMLNIHHKEPDFKTNCISCFKKLKKEPIQISDELMRACVDCGALKILKTEPEYKNRCIPCFKLTKTNIQMRECINCKELNIPSSYPSFKNKCISCYKLDINNTLKECSECNNLKIPYNAPLNKHICDDCMKEHNINKYSFIPDIPEFMEMDSTNKSIINSLMNVKI